MNPADIETFRKEIMAQGGALFQTQQQLTAIAVTIQEFSARYERNMEVLHDRIQGLA